MLYFNNELVKEKDKKLFDQFCALYKNHIDARKIRTNTPFILKYRSDLISDDIYNKGKKLMPNSIALKLTSLVNINGNMTEVRYSEIAPKVDKDGTKFTINATMVEHGRKIVHDIDLAFYFWAYSNQNFENYPDNTQAYFVLDNPEAEAAALALAKRSEITAKARIWNEESDGGLSERRLRTVAKDMMIANADVMDINELRQILDETVTREKGTRHNRDLFLKLSEPIKDIVELQKNENYAERKAIVGDAIKMDIISHDTFKNKFFLNDQNGVPITELFDYSALAKAGDKSQRSALLYAFLEENQPNTIGELAKQISNRKSLVTT